jgi:hypothetical protein
VAEHDLDTLYARLDQTQPGSEESKSISREIIDAIGQDDPLVQRLKEWEATAKDSPERLEAFRRALQTLHDEHKVIVTDENYSEILKRFRSLVPHTPEWEGLGDALGKWMLG